MKEINEILRLQKSLIFHRNEYLKTKKEYVEKQRLMNNSTKVLFNKFRNENIIIQSSMNFKSGQGVSFNLSGELKKRFGKFGKCDNKPVIWEIVNGILTDIPYPLINLRTVKKAKCLPII